MKSFRRSHPSMVEEMVAAGASRPMFEIKSAGAIRTMHSVFVEAKQDQGWMGWQLDTILDNHKRGRV